MTSREWISVGALCLALCLLLAVQGCTLHFKATEAELDTQVSGYYSFQSMDFNNGENPDR